MDRLPVTNSMFADYAARATNQPRASLPAELTIVPATVADAAGIGRLTAQREGKSFEQTLASTLSGMRADAERGNLVLSARKGALVVGFARARFMQFDSESTSDIPAGWYLLSVIVAPEFRRRGIASELTRLRLEWIARRAQEAFYYANSLNLASIDLHRRLGFVEIRRPFDPPGSQFSGGGVGVLFRIDLARRAGAMP
jgi:ribosomal protein S18 acetylase RimI-like enzyme